ncbi:MAG: phosphohistidine phosphatase SixA [Thermodesulfovibrionaceae bacterium]
MFLYLVQHAEAKPESEDPQRGLSEKGLKDIGKVANFLSKLNLQVDEILHSDKLRAKQTAEVLAEALKVKASETDSLAPLDNPQVWAERLKTVDKSIMLVGHLPHLSYLTSMLLCGEREKGIVSFRMGGVLCLKKDKELWSINWMITPEIIPE